jgi:hypothetical protein
MSLVNPYNIDWKNFDDNVMLSTLITHNFALSPHENKSKSNIKYTKTYNIQKDVVIDICNNNKDEIKSADWSNIEKDIVERGVDTSRLIKNPPQHLIHICCAKWWKMLGTSNLIDYNANMAVQSIKLENMIGVKRMYALKKDVGMIREGHFLVEVVDKDKFAWAKITHNI